MKYFPGYQVVGHKTLSTAAVIMLISATVLSGCTDSSATAENGSGASEHGQLQVVDVLELQPKTLTLSTELSGRVSPFTIAEVRPQVDGIVLERTFKEGADIAKDEVLYRIDPAIYQAEVASAKASLAQSQANLKAAQSKARRYQNLLASKAVSQQEYDDTDALYKQAAAAVELAKAHLLRAEIDLDYTQIKSPIDGRVGRSSVTQGALVTANQAASLATVQQLDPIYVDLTQSSVELLGLRQQIAAANSQEEPPEDVSVELELEDGTLYPHPGKLAFSEVSVNEGTGSVTLRVVVPNPDQWLLPGMFVRARVDTTEIDDALLLPPLAVSRTAKGEPSVMLVSTEQKVELRVLNRAEMHHGEWLVEGGVTAGDRVIVGGLQKVFPGMPVQVSSGDTAASTDPAQHR